MDRNGDGDLNELQILSRKYRDFMTDLDFAFNLQLQEAITASLSFGTSSSHASPIPELHDADQTFFNVGIIQRMGRSTFEIERHDRELETEKNGVGISSSASSSKAADRLETFRVYFKSFVLDSDAPVVGGIGIAICDLKDNLIFELGKTMPGSDRNRLGADCSALIEALNAALSLNIRRVEVYFDSFPLFQYIRGRWRPKQTKIRALVDQVSLLRNKFAFIDEVFVAQRYIKYAVKLAREAIDAQLNQPPESSSSQATSTCVICLDNVSTTQMFQTDNCSHSYCFSCMKKHVEEKLLNGILPKCPNEKCNFELKIESCLVFLPPKLVEIFRERIKEASIPATEKVYCPFPTCSALMCKDDMMSRKNILENLMVSIFASRQDGARRCVKCKNFFCINCKVPWHENLSCRDYKRLNYDPLAEEVKLMNLADVNLWRQCKSCSNMIELASGCYHITCRCGYEFCYNCGAEWKDKVATCSCPLWADENIVDDDDDEYNEEEEEEEEEFEDYYYGYFEDLL